MPTVNVSSARRRLRLAVGILVAVGLFAVAGGVLVGTPFQSPTAAVVLNRALPSEDPSTTDPSPPVAAARRPVGVTTSVSAKNFVASPLFA